MIYGTNDELFEVSDRSLKLGRLVAVNQYTKSLIRYGHFEEYRIYCEDQKSLEGAQSRLEASLTESELERVVLTLKANLQTDFTDVPFSAFHHSAGWTAVSNLAPIRNQFASQAFPISALIHSLNEPNAYLKALKLGLSNVRPCDAIVCTSEGGRRVLKSFFEAVAENLKEWGKIEFEGELAKIPLGVDTDFFQPQDRQACREKLGIPRDATVLLHLGRLSAHDKADPGPLFYLLRQLVEARPNEKLLLILAGGAEAENIASFKSTCQEIGIADKVQFRPNFEDEEKPLLYGACDIFVSLIDSLQETFGIAAVEAMACGRAAVLSDFDGYKELVENRKSGLLVPTYWAPADRFLHPVSTVMNAKLYQLFLSQSVVVNIPAALKSLLELIDRPELRKELETAARTQATERFSWKVVIGQYEELWAELAKRAKKLPTLSNPQPDPLAVDYYRCFSHYPSALVEPQWKASLTAFGKRAIAGEGIPAIYSDIANLISEDWLKVLIQQLVQGPQEVGKLVGFARHKFGAPESVMLFHILWLAKYDVIELVP